MRPVEKRGFTFTELVACLAIIMVLMSLLLPVFTRARESARRTSCASNLVQLGQALHLYAQDFDGRFPARDNDWTLTCLRYTKNYAVYACPTEPESSKARFGAGRFLALPKQPPVLYSSYQYRGGCANDDLGAVPLARDWSPWHSHGVDVLYLSGAVQWLPLKDAPNVLSTDRPAPPAGAVRSNPTAE